MIRKSTINLNFSNKSKLEKLHKIFEEYQQVTNYFINYIWSHNLFSGKFLTDTNHCQNTWLSARLRQCAAKQALSIVKSQRKKKRKTKPEFSGNSIELDSRFFELFQDVNSFDLWIKLGSIGDKIIIYLPSKKHKHFNDLQASNWQLKKSCRIRRNNSGFFCDLFFEKETPKPKLKGRIIGLDTGFKKLAVISDGYIFGREIENYCHDISTKQRNSKNYLSSICTRNAYIDKEIKYLVKYCLTNNIKEIKVENLKNLKYKSKFSNKFNNIYQYWVYSRFLTRLKLQMEIIGVQVSSVNPRYTSQTCSYCKNINKDSRKRELYECVRCGRVSDADHNAAINILFSSRI